jgi:PhoH-like ATPase
MVKTYILDTSTIISDPNCLKSFPNSKIIIHLSALNELDKLKSFPNETGKSARVFIRLLDKLSESGNIHKGMLTDNGATIEIDTNEYKSDILGDSDYGDNRMLACALAIKDQNPTVVTKDIGFRIRARALDIDAIDHEKFNHMTDDLHSGFREIQSETFGNKIRKGQSIELKSYPALKEVHPNECIYFTDENKEVISLAKRNCKFVHPLISTKPWNLSSRNIEQAFAIDLLLDPKIPLVTLSGLAGTGKSLIAVACGLEAVINQNRYDNMFIYRPIQPVGKDVGFLPGSLEEKLEPWMGAINDSLDLLASQCSKDKGGKRQTNWKDKLGYFSDRIHMEALTHIRGRSIANTFILVDECQNISKEEIKTILTRVGENTKIVLTGDIEQIDDNRLDALNNGLTYVIENFKSSELAGHISLKEGVRSPLASEAAKIL